MNKGPLGLGKMMLGYFFMTDAQKVSLMDRYFEMSHFRLAMFAVTPTPL